MKELRSVTESAFVCSIFYQFHYRAQRAYTYNDSEYLTHNETVHDEMGDMKPRARTEEELDGPEKEKWNKNGFDINGWRPPWLWTVLCKALISRTNFRRYTKFWEAMYF